MNVSRSSARLSSCMIFSLVLGSTAWAKCDADEMQITIGSVTGSANPVRTAALAEIKRVVDEDMQGKACIQLLSDPQRFGERKILKALADQKVLMAMPELATLARQVPAYSIFQLPFAFKHFRAAEAFAADAQLDVLNTKLGEIRLRGLSYLHRGFVQTVTTRRVINPQDMAGMKIDVSSSPNDLAISSELRGVPKRTESQALNAAVEKDEIDAVFTDWAGASRKEFTAKLKYTLESNYRYRGYRLIARADWFDGLPAALRTQLAQSISRAAKQADFETKRRARGDRNKLISSGREVYALSERQRARWLDVAAAVWASYSEPAGARFLPVLRRVSQTP